MKSILVFLLMVLMATTAFAAPFLVADPPPAEQQVIHYNVYKNGVLEGTFTGETLNYDLEGIVPGVYNFTAEACNVWGCTITPDPYVSPGVAGTPMSLRLTP